MALSSLSRAPAWMSLKSAGGRPRRAATRARKSLRGASSGGASRANLEKSQRMQDGQRLGDADLSRASLMTSGIFGLAFTMSAEPEPEHPVRQQRMRPVAALLINRSSASPVPPSIPPSLQAKMLAVRPPTPPLATLLTLHSTLPRPSPCLLQSMTLLPPSSAPLSPQMPSRTPFPFPLALRPLAFADASGPVSPSMTSHPAVLRAQVPAAQRAQG